jgi:hypothetical protein
MFLMIGVALNAAQKKANTYEGLAKPIKASGISSQNGQKKKIAGPKVIK